MSVRPLCAGGCGFHGSKDTKNFCSLCYKKMFPEEAFALFEKQPMDHDKIKDHETKQDLDTNNSNDLNTKKGDVSNKNKKIQKKKNRCWQCHKKLNLAAQFKCKCDYVFCSQHRYYDAHECHVVDSKTKNKQNLEKNNKKIIASKVPPIS